MTLLETPDRPQSALATPARPPVLADGLLLTGVRRSWSRREVLRGVELELVPGTANWLGGRNGAGKTTLLRIAAGAIAPDAGTVLLDGLSPRRARRAFQERIGLLSAGDRAMYGRLTVRHHLEMWARFAMVPRASRAPAIARALARFELEELADRRLDRMSMGQRQRARLAMVFLHDPAVVLLDEPHTSLDDDGRELVARALDELRARGGAALWCSPLGDRIDYAFDERWMLDDGLLVAA